jgi:CIC family chloride channel protein
MLGGSMAVLDRVVLGHGDTPAGAFALVGMGAVFSGVIRAPITSVLIIIEMTRGYSLILPLMIANMSAYALARHFRPRPIFEALLAQDGIELPSASAGVGLEGRTISEAINRSGPFHEFVLATAAPEIARVAHASSKQHVFPVVDAEKHLLGIVTPDELRLLDSEPDLLPVVAALDLMRPAVSVRPEDDLRTVLEVMLQHSIREVPVTDRAGRFVGFVDEAAVAQAFVKAQPRP